MEHSSKIAFYTSLFRCAGITLIILMVWHIWLSSLVHLQREKNIQRHLLISEKVLDIMQYEKRQEKIMNSEARLTFIATLRHQNKEAALILTELNKMASDSIEFSAVKWQDRLIWIEGYSRSDLELRVWMDSLAKSTVLTQPVITSLADKNQLRYFQLKMGLK